MLPIHEVKYCASVIYFPLIKAMLISHHVLNLIDPFSVGLFISYNSFNLMYVKWKGRVKHWNETRILSF